MGKQRLSDTHSDHITIKRVATCIWLPKAILTPCKRLVESRWVLGSLLMERDGHEKTEDEPAA